jgi:hypothetical protein
MSKRKLMIILVSTLALIAILAFTVPVIAADTATSIPPAQITQVNKAKVLARLLLVRDEAKVDAFLAKAVSAKKITEEQAIKIKGFWETHHSNFAKNLILGRLLRTQDESKVKNFLDKAVASGKIQQAQEDKILQAWEVLHAPLPAAGNAQ